MLSTFVKVPSLLRLFLNGRFTDVLLYLMINPFKPNGISLSYKLDQSISVLRVTWWYFSYLFKN